MGLMRGSCTWCHSSTGLWSCASQSRRTSIHLATVMDRQPSRNAGVNVSGQSRSAGESVMAACGTGVRV
eukprot:3263944-Prorocentrum_lima.AAC.1